MARTTTIHYFHHILSLFQVSDQTDQSNLRSESCSKKEKGTPFENFRFWAKIFKVDFLSLIDTTRSEMVKEERIIQFGAL